MSMQKWLALQRFVGVQCLAAILFVVIYDEDLITRPHWLVSMFDFPWWIVWFLAIWIAQFWVACGLSLLGWKVWSKLLAGLLGPLVFLAVAEITGRIEGAYTPELDFDSFLSYVLGFVNAVIFLFWPVWAGLFLRRKGPPKKETAASPHPEGNPAFS
jgi:hypothetical protein